MLAERATPSVHPDVAGTRPESDGVTLQQAPPDTGRRDFRP